MPLKLCWWDSSKFSLTVTSVIITYLVAFCTTNMHIYHKVAIWHLMQALVRLLSVLFNRSLLLMMFCATGTTQHHLLSFFSLCLAWGYFAMESLSCFIVLLVVQLLVSDITFATTPISPNKAFVQKLRTQSFASVKLSLPISTHPFLLHWPSNCSSYFSVNLPGHTWCSSRVDILFLDYHLQSLVTCSKLHPHSK